MCTYILRSVQPACDNKKIIKLRETDEKVKRKERRDDSERERDRRAPYIYNFNL